MTSCGKPIESSKESDSNIVVRPELNPNLSFMMSFEGEAEQQTQSHMFERDGRVVIPANIHLQSGAPDHYNVTLVFNTRESSDQRDAMSEFFCKYESIKYFKGYQHKFLGCFQDIDGDGVNDNLGYKAGQKVFQERWNYIRAELTSGYSDTTAEILTELEVEWF